MLHNRGIEIQETVEARNEKIEADQAWNLLRQAKEIIVGQGKKCSILHSSNGDRSAILSQCLGRTGTLRAPTLKIGDRYLVGFNEEMYETYLG